MAHITAIKDVINRDSILIEKKTFNNIDALFTVIADTAVTAHQPLAAKSHHPIPSEQLQRSLMKRATKYPFGTGGGLLLPLAEINEVHEFFAVFVKLTAGQSIKGAPDGELVDLVFALFGPRDSYRSDLRLLATMALALSNRDLRGELREARTIEQIYQALISPIPA